MRRLGLLAVPLLLAACGASTGSQARRPAATTGATDTAAVAPRRAVHLTAPSGRRPIAGQPLGRRLRAVVQVAGTAAPGQQLALRGACGGLDCEGITFAAADGRWRTRLEVFTPPGRHTVRLTVGYAAPRAGETTVVRALRLRQATAPPPPPSRPAPASTLTGPGGGAAAGSAAPYGGPRTMIVIGDSLAMGMAQPLRADLPGWSVSIDGRIGRPLAEGMQILAATRLPGGSRGSHAILAFSLFTNDGPTAVDALEAAVRQSVSRLGSHGCAIWATIARPPYGGVSYRAANARLEALVGDPALAGRLLLVPWQREYARHPSWQAGDGVHATPAGYAARAKMYADAARACPA